MSEDGVPAWATEPVHVVEHDPRWADQAVELAEEIRALFAHRLSGDVVHVGSTAVPGLAAKPIIDLQALADDPAVMVDEVAAAAGARHWMFVPRELDRRPWRWFFIRTDARAQRRVAHLHLMAPGEPRWAEQLVFRDRLRADVRLRDAYAAVKHAAAAEHPHDREAYGDAKSAFVRRVVEEVG